MHWQDEGLVLRVRQHGERSAVVVVLTREHGRHAGLVRGATSPALRGVLQAGNRVTATWSARLAEQLGQFRIEPRTSHAPALFDDSLKLAGLSSAVSVAERSLPEREPHPAIHDGLLALIRLMEQDELGDAWIAAYVRWELGLLDELGFGLDLSCCAVSGQQDRLAFVSPRTGRAVTSEAAEPYRDRLLVLPEFLAGRGGGDPDDIRAGMKLTGHFLARHLFGAHGQPQPPARVRFSGLLESRN